MQCDSVQFMLIAELEGELPNALTGENPNERNFSA